MKEITKRAIRTILPMRMRKNIALWLNKQDWIAKERRAWWSVELIRDLALADANDFHRFLWSNHLSYAETYEVDARFGPERMNGSRRIFFRDLTDFLRKNDVEIKSVFEAGASLGYQLRYMETELFPDAEVFEGIDIDAYSVREGGRYLRAAGSKVSLRCGDLIEIEKLPGPKTYDLVVCTGVLMYLKEESAAKVVAELLRRTGKILALSGLANPVTENCRLAASTIRERDLSFIHNLEKMVEDGGGKVLWKRWEGPRMVDGNTIYFVFATARDAAVGGRR